MKQKWWIRSILLAALPLLCCSLWLWKRSDMKMPSISGSKLKTVSEQNFSELWTANAHSEDRAYYDAISWKDGFLAAGSQGRVTRIGLDGSSELLLETHEDTFLDIAAGGGTAAAISLSGTVAAVDEGGEIVTYSAKEGHTYSSICFFRGQWLTGGSGGWLLQAADLSTWQPLEVPISGTITGLAATEDRCIGVTDQGEIFTSADGIHWSVLNYNEYYQQSISLQGIEALDAMFWAYGTRPDGTSTLILSMEGGVWLERSLILEGQSQQADLSRLEIGGLCSDGEQAIAALSDGTALTMPSCAVCNKLTRIADWQLEAAAYNGGKLLFAGEGYQYQILELEDIRQERIQAEAALEKYQAGALILDVRSAEEYAEGHIAGSIRINLDRIDKELPDVCPEQSREIIFYCASGKRSQQALERAQTLGYHNVYNLGGLTDWPYGTETGSQAQ